ncbi:hypothetical protein JCM10212_006574 [Sporobolomyces blumeae]
MSNPPKLSFGLNKAALPRQAPKKTVQKSSAFTLGGGDSDDDGDGRSEPIASTSKPTRPRPGAATPAGTGVSTAKLSKAQRLKQQQELELDSSAYEYDEVYDKMKAGEKAVQAERMKEAGDRKPKYISRLMETAELRKQDRLRAEDKMIQREREREGDEFKDKDAFVTPAYLAQQEELRKVEEEERKREEANAGKSGGMSKFLKSYLDSTSAAHDAAVAASQSKDEPTKPKFTVAPPPKEKTDVELAREFEEQTGRKVEVNDDGEIIDKRQLMAGGLNVVAKPKLGPHKPGGFAAPISARTAPSSSSTGSDGTLDSLLHPGVSAAERKRQMRERQSREIERQMVALEARRKREAEEQLQHKVDKVAKRNDDDKVARLKAAAEARRKQREQAGSAAPA